MPSRQQQQQRGQQPRALTTAPPQERTDGPSRALVAVTHEIDNRLAIVGASAAAGIRPDRLKLVALGAFTRTPSLWTCEPVSVARAIVEAAQLGLEPTGLLGGAYLVPRGGKATLLVGYRGLVMLAKRSGEVQRVEARVVRAKDKFDYGYGLDPYLHHVPSTDVDPGAYTGAYAVLFYRDGSRQFDYMSIAEIEAIRKRSSSPNEGPWVSDYAEMCKKTPLRRLMKMAPLTIDVASKLDEIDPEVDEAAPATGRQAEIRQQLQQALEREYGTSPGTTEGTFTEVPPAGGATTQASEAGTPAGVADPAATAAPAAANTAGEAREAGAASAVPAAAAPPPATEPEPKGKPERVSEVLNSTCGAVHQALGVGPCVLPAGHEEHPWKGSDGQDMAPQGEHEEAGGTRWTQPRAKA